MSAKLLVLFFLLAVFQACSRKVEEDEYEDVTGNQKWVLAPKTQDTDATLILNKLLREYDKKLRPDIGSRGTKNGEGINLKCPTVNALLLIDFYREIREIIPTPEYEQKCSDSKCI
ncbi:Gamma-aminobutyric acid receptor subunit gamma-3 [Chelonia mydas]|uniref:Gamma-aminobutyric acid receptor subunit gamma-3 n=1 Tax=Chelonia mydas TaxID=8469 RepID=M7BAG5_CHEMY|nr:Gamma-aminobutyric acid receptor subunit gamma-3 [Chelonia mydas]